MTPITPLESALLSLAQPVIASAAVAILGALVLAARKWLAAHPKTVPLSDVMDVAGQALEAAVKTVGGGTWPPNAAAWKQAEQSTFAVVLAHKGQLEEDAIAELKTLCSTAVALKAGQPVTAPGGATVAMPTPIKALLPLVLALGLAVPARAQSAAPPVQTAPASSASPATGAATLKLSAVDWKTVNFQHGPSLPLIVLNPKDIHPISVAPGAGYYAGACFGQAVLNGAHAGLLCASGQAFLSVISPAGTSEGGVQVALMAGVLANAIAVGPLLTPWTAAGNGFLQAGRPGTSWAATLDPVSIYHLLGGP
ncbi:MAG: hypothetical protein ACYDD4_14860 [Acidimicrobiales bacterium]